MIVKKYSQILFCPEDHRRLNEVLVNVVRSIFSPSKSDRLKKMFNGRIAESLTRRGE